MPIEEEAAVEVDSMEGATHPSQAAQRISLCVGATN
jgi:hypothetical protein